MAAWYVCTVNEVGPASDGTETAQPVIYVNLTDVSGSFTGQWFFAAENARTEMLAVALSAISLGKQVDYRPDQPNARRVAIYAVLPDVRRRIASFVVAARLGSRDGRHCRRSCQGC